MKEKECKINSKIKTETDSLSTSPTQSSDVILFFEPLEINTSNLAENTIQLDNEEFMRGLKDSSYVCGMYTGLLNSGISVEDAIEIVIGKLNIEHSLEVVKINASASIECSKYATLVKEKELL